MRAVVATFRSAVAEALANRAALWSQAGAMALNDLVWVMFWVILFERVGSLRGWDASHLMLLMSVLTASGGISLGLLSNARRIGDLATGGELDAVLTLPVPPLAHVLASRVDAINLGDLAFGVGLFLVAGEPSPGRAAIFAVGVAGSVAVLTGFLVATSSLAFFLGRGEAGEMAMHAVIVLANYPAPVFSGTSRVLLYSAVPAAFVGAVPARLMFDFDPAAAAGLLGAGAAFMTLGWLTFTRGLRRYTSGSTWARA